MLEADCPPAPAVVLAFAEELAAVLLEAAGLVLSSLMLAACAMGTEDELLILTIMLHTRS